MINLLISAGVALMAALLGTPLAIRVLVSRGIGQEIREELPDHHQVKRGKPTMGGLVIVGAAILGYLIAHVPIGRHVVLSGEGALAIGTIAALAFVGFLDDYIKVHHRRSLGLNKRAKLAGQVAIGIAFGVIAVRVLGLPTRLSFVAPSRLDLRILFFVWVLFLISGFSNGVNLADGMDGLAAGSAALVYAAFVIVAFWKFTHPDIYQVEGALDVATVAAGMMGACAGFLWWNANPAQIIMGDTGALALGGGMAVMALLADAQLLLIVLGGLYVVETLSVIMQVFTFRVMGGKRIFRMAPIHHHFELLGWPEITVIVRFWIVSGLFVALGLGLFYADFLARGGGG
jgi:phospho-N-acetylmuramoyl-pentapeptide-transferase